MPAPTISLTQSMVMEALGNFILQVIPALTAANIVWGQENQVDEPAGPDFVEMTPIMGDRIAHNIGRVRDGQFDAPATPGVRLATQNSELTIQLDIHGPASQDNAHLLATLLNDAYAVEFFQPGPCRFTGSIAEALLTVSDSTSGALLPGMAISGPGVPFGVGTIVGAQASGSPAGGPGTYAISPPMTVPSAPMTGFIPYVLSPLYATNRGERPFFNAENQAEMVWTIDACFQIAPVVTLPQDFATAVTVTTAPAGL